jgi:hypothetical protein
MSLHTRLLGGAMSFAHLAGLGKAPGKKAKAKTAADDQDEDDKPDASEDDDEGDKPKGKKAKGKADDDKDDDDKPDASEDDDDDDDKSMEDDDDKPDASEDDDEEDDPPSRGKKAKGKSAEYRRGVTAERQRCAKIFGHSAAGRNQPLAASLAFNTGMSAAEAINVLKGQAASAGQGAGRRNPDLGTDPGDQSTSGNIGKSWGAALAKAGVAPAAQSGGWGAAAERARR